MTLQDQLDALLEATAYDSTGTKIGAVRQVYVDNGTGKATFATVATGVFSADAIVPLHGARLLDDEVHLDHTRQAVKDSPRLDHTEDSLTPPQEAELLEHYGLEAPWVRGDGAERGEAAGGDGRTAGPTAPARDSAPAPATASTTTARSTTAPQGAESKGAEVKGAEVKGTESKGTESKGAGAPPAGSAATGTAPAGRRSGSSRIDIAALKRDPAS